MRRVIKRDNIDEINEKKQIGKSIVKYWNVNYNPVPPRDEAAEILERLEAERLEDEAKKRDEINRIIEEVRNREETFNATTGSYSGSYGAKEVQDEATKGQIDKILHEKSDVIRDIVEHGGE